MKIGVMQPYLFPYLGYYSLIKHTDLFILLDAVQYIRHGWIERNRVLKENSGWLYIQVPLIKDNGRNTIISDIRINNDLPWRQKILSQLRPYRKFAPYYNAIIEIMEELFSNQFDDIVSLDKAAITKVCEYLNIHTTIKVYTEMGLEIEKPSAPDEWALNICKALGNVIEYWNPPGGRDFFYKEKFDQANIQLKFQRINLTSYSQQSTTFEAGLSIIDVLMLNSVETIHEMLDNFDLL